MATLGGTCGIPGYDHRVYVSVSCDVDAEGQLSPRVIHWDGGRDFVIESCVSMWSRGRWEAGNLVLHWKVELKCRGRPQRDLWWERGRFFVRQLVTEAY